MELKDKEYWAEEERKTIELHKTRLIPFAKSRPDLFDVSEEAGITYIVYNKTLFSKEDFDYQQIEVSYDRYNDQKYRDATNHRFLIYENTSPLSDVIQVYFDNEIRTGYESAVNLIKKAKTLIDQDPRSDFFSRYLYFEEIMDTLVRFGISQSIIDAVFTTLHEKWSEPNNFEEKLFNESAITPCTRLTKKLMEICKKETNPTEIAKRKRMEAIKEREEKKQREFLENRKKPRLINNNH